MVEAQRLYDMRTKLVATAKELDEGGASLRGGGAWSRPSRPLADTPSTCAAPNACGRRRAARTKGSTRMPIDCCRAREARPC